MAITRRDLLGLGGLTMVGAALAPAPARAQAPKPGGTLSLRLWDPPHFDPYLQVSYKPRHLAKQQYYVRLASTVYVAVWDRALKNYGPNLGFDWGSRLTAAWLDR